MKSGEVLFAAGDPGDALYLVLFGRLRADARPDSPGEQILGEIGRGESVGEMALLTGEPRSATVYAVRNTELLRLSKAGFEQLAEREPQILLELARLITLRYSSLIAAPPINRHVAIALVPCNRDVAIDSVARQFAAVLSEGRSVLLLDRQRLQRELRPDQSWFDYEESELYQWLDAQELRHAHVVYAADPAPSPWTRLCLRQADLVLLLAPGSTPPRIDPGLAQMLEGNEHGRARRELVLLYDSATREPAGTSEWLKHLAVGAHHHIDPQRAGDRARLVRMVTGNAVGLVLGGGGARALSHIGVIRALEEAGIPVDLVGGTSIGAVLGGQHACGWNSERMLAECRKAFLEGGSLNDFSLPVIALMQGRRYAKMLGKLFGDRRIEDLPLPYYCISANLTRSECSVHRTGPMRKWVAASMAVPGLAPPIFDGHDILVDGGVLNNLPIDVMRGLARGPVFASNVSPRVELRLDREYADLPSPWRVLWSRVNPFCPPMRVPNIVSILMRATSMSTSIPRAQSYPGADLVFEPPVEGHKLLEWRSLDKLVDIGYRSAAATIEAWQRRRTEAVS